MKTWTEHGRKKPYTQIGISRIPCFRCGDQAVHQWNICSDDNLFRPVCLDCDIKLNELTLRFMGFSNVGDKMKKYIESQI